MDGIEFDLSNITFAELEAKLGPPTFRGPLGEATLLRWMLPNEPFYLSASFLLFGQNIEPTNIPTSVILAGPPQTSVTSVKIAGVAPGSSEQLVQEIFERRGITPLPGYKRFQWDADWIVQWIAVKGKVSMVICLNEGLVGRIWDDRKQAQERPPSV